MRPVTLFILLPLLAACAAPAPREPAQRLEAQAPLPPAPPRLSADEVVALVRSGTSADEIIDRLRRSGSRLTLSAAQIISLRERGVPLELIDRILELERSALQADYAEQLIRQDAEHARRLQQQERELARRCDAYCAPYYGPGLWPYGPYPRSGIYWWFGR